MTEVVAGQEQEVIRLMREHQKMAWREIERLRAEIERCNAELNRLRALAREHTGRTAP